MKGKDLAKILLDKYPDHEIVVQEYTGCNHTIYEAKELNAANKGEVLKSWNNSGDKNFVLKTGAAKKKVLLIR